MSKTPWYTGRKHDNEEWIINKEHPIRRVSRYKRRGGINKGVDITEFRVCLHIAFVISEKVQWRASYTLPLVPPHAMCHMRPLAKGICKELSPRVYSLCFFLCLFFRSRIIKLAWWLFILLLSQLNLLDKGKKVLKRYHHPNIAYLAKPFFVDAFEVNVPINVTRKG